MGSSFFSSVRNATRSANKYNELTNNWVRRLGVVATTAEARDSHSQLSAILDHYNQKKTQGEVAEIDWEGHKERIHTEGVVDKIRAKYEKFNESEYGVDSAVSRLGHTTEKMQALETALTYNFMLYFAHYIMHIEQLETMRNIGDVSQMSFLEMTELMGGSEVLSSIDQEMGDLSPEDYIENGIYTRICTQFSWGTDHIPPFVHSNDATNCVAATLAKGGT